MAIRRDSVNSKHEQRQPFSGVTHPCIVCYADRLAGLVVKASASSAEDPWFDSHLRRDFSGSNHTSDFKISTPVATLPGAWRDKVSVGTVRPRIDLLWQGEVESLISNFYLSVTARPIV